MSIIVVINDGRRKVNYKKFMLHYFAIDSTFNGNSIFKFSESCEDVDINILFNKFNGSNISDKDMPVGYKVGQSTLL